MVFLVPPFQVPDEPSHFFRAYQVSQFDFMPEDQYNILGGELPESLFNIMRVVQITPGKQDEKFRQSMLDSALKIKLEPDKKIFIQFPNTALYSPIAYFPQATGIFIGRIFSLSPLILLYTARIFNLLVWVIVLYFALKITPINKWLFLALALTPMSIHLVASASVDTFLIALSFLFIAIIFRLAYDEKTTLGRREMFLLLLITVLIALSKNIYVILVLLFFIIPVRKAGSRKNYFFKATILCASGLTVFIVSSFIVSHLVGQIDPIENFYGDNSIVSKINPKKQIQFILSDIPRFFGMILYSFSTLWQFVTESFIGYLGWAEVQLGRTYYHFAYLILFFLAVFGNSKVVRIRFLDRFLMVLVFAGGILSFSFTMYCSWTEPGSPIIQNLQGRYFIPVVPLALSAMNINQLNIPKWVFPLVLILFISVSILLTIKALLIRFYF